MWEVVIRRGGFTTPLPNNPPFDRREIAEQFARDFLASNPDAIQKGLEAIEVRPVQIDHA
jgi:hypothetical protein